MSEETTTKKRHIGRIILWIILALIILGIVAMIAKKPPKEKTEVPQEKAVAVRTVVIDPQSMPSIVTIPGKMEALIEATLSTEKPGLIVELPSDKGDAVEQGQILMKLDERTWAAMLSQAKVESKQAKKDLKRWKEMEKSGAVSSKEYDDIKLRKEAADVQLEQAEISLSQCVVKSPVNGHIADRYMELGEYANEGQAVFLVVDTSKIKVRFDVPEQNILSVEPGKKIDFKVDALAGREFSGSVSFVSPLASRENNAFSAEVLVDNDEGLLKPGMIAALDLQLSITENAMVVPLAAVIPRKGEHIIFIVENDHAVRRTVKIDAIIDDSVILLSGINAGETLIVEGHRALADGMLLQIEN